MIPFAVTPSEAITPSLAITVAHDNAVTDQNSELFLLMVNIWHSKSGWGSGQELAPTATQTRCVPIQKLRFPLYFQRVRGSQVNGKTSI